MVGYNGNNGAGSALPHSGAGARLGVRGVAGYNRNNGAGPPALPHLGAGVRVGVWGVAGYNGNNGAGVRWSMGSGRLQRKQRRRSPLLLHPLLPLELLMSYRDARITNSRKSMSLLPEKIMKTFSQR